MTDAEKQVAGKTYRYTTRSIYAGIVRTFGPDGRCVETCYLFPSDVLPLMRDGQLEEVTPEPEVRVGDRLETVHPIWPAYAPVPTIAVGVAVVVERVVERLMFVRPVGGGAGTWQAIGSVNLRRLPPEPKAEGWGEKFARALAPKLMEIWASTEAVCHSVRTPECACLQPSCMPCQAKLSDDALMRGRMELRDAEAGLAAYQARRQVLPSPLQWSPMAGVGMWSGRGRR